MYVEDELNVRGLARKVEDKVEVRESPGSAHTYEDTGPVYIEDELNVGGLATKVEVRWRREANKA